MKKYLLTFTFITLISSTAFATIDVPQKIKVGNATYSCTRKSCELVDGKAEKNAEFEYTSITTSNSGNSVVKKQYKCKTTETGVHCKSKY